MTVCYHVTYSFQSESTLYSCLNVKQRLAGNRCDIWSSHDDDDDDDDDNDDELIMNCTCGMVDQWKVFISLISSRDHCQSSSPLQISTSRIWICTVTEFKLCWMKLGCSDNHHTMAPQHWQQQDSNQQRLSS